jgi:hypothetical protein
MSPAYSGPVRTERVLAISPARQAGRNVRIYDALIARLLLTAKRPVGKRIGPSVNGGRGRGGWAELHRIAGWLSERWQGEARELLGPDP